MDWLQFTILIFTLLGTMYYTNQRIDAYDAVRKKRNQEWKSLEDKYIKEILKLKDEGEN
jgi:hypothetical protein